MREQIWSAPAPTNEKKSGRLLGFNHLSSSVPCGKATNQRRYLMNRQRVLSILWAIEILAGVLPAIVVLGMAMISYVVLLEVVPQLLHRGETAALRTYVLATGTIVGGVLGIAAILIAYRPEKLRRRPRRKRLAIAFGCAGLCAEVLYFTNGGLGDVSSHWLARWVMLGPLVVGVHCAYRVFGRSPGPTPSPVAVR
jgi:peptidoglycan/LPS O-acetylase OafA/YrhL